MPEEFNWKVSIIIHSNLTICQTKRQSDTSIFYTKGQEVNK